MRIVSAPRRHSEAGIGFVHQKRADFLLYMLKNVVSKAELMGLDTDSLAIKHSSEQSA